MSDFWLVLILPALLIYVFRKDLRNQILWAGLLSIPVLAIKPLISPDFYSIAKANGGLLPFLAVRVVTGFAIGMLASWAYETLLHKKFTPKKHPSRKELIWLLAGPLLFIVSFYSLHTSFIVGLCISLLLDLVIVLLLRKSLIWDTIFSGFCMGIVYLALFALLFRGFPGDIRNLWFSSEISGLNLFSVPIEELIVAFLFGALWGPVYIALEDLREIHDRRKFNPINLSRKRIFGIILIVIFLVVSTVALIFVLTKPKISRSTPRNEESNVTSQPIITIDFNMAVKRDQALLNISPSVIGNWQYENNILGNHLYRKLVFVPEAEFEPATQYTISIKHAGGFSNFGRYSDLSLRFTTQDADKSVAVTSDPVPVAPALVAAVISKSNPKAISVTTAPSLPSTPQVLLNIAVDYQDKALSCEAASLKMALSYKGAQVTEDDIMSIVGFDYTIRNGDVWGNPNNAFVGDINGKQDTTGYGVYWGPIARAANNWRSAEAFSGWSMSQLAQELSKDNPIVIWGTYGGSAYSDNWHAPDGTAIIAWKGEHARTIIGFKGTVENPTQFIINDPIAGRLTWSASELSSNAAAFGTSGVVIR